MRLLLCKRKHFRLVILGNTCHCILIIYELTILNIQIEFLLKLTNLRPFQWLMRKYNHTRKEQEHEYFLSGKRFRSKLAKFSICGRGNAHHKVSAVAMDIRIEHL